MRSAAPATRPKSWLISSRAMPSSRTSLSSSSITRAWVTASSAVVGSSATSRQGLSAMAAAMATRWRWPPESWCGRRSSGTPSSPTRSRVWRAMARASRREARPWARTVSATWAPMDMTGFSAVDGSWNTTATSRPRTSCNSRSGRPSSARPRSKMRPATRAPSGARPRIDRAVSDLPDPLWPTRPSTSPAPRIRSTPRTASPAAKPTFSFSICSSGSLMPAPPPRSGDAGLRPAG